MRGQNAKPIPSELYNVSKGGFVTSAEQVKDYRNGKSQENINNELYTLISSPRSKSVIVHATEDTTSVTEILPAVGSVDTLYRVTDWNGVEYIPDKMAEYGWNGSSYTLLYVNDYGIDDEPTLDSPNTVTSGGVAAVEGYYDENPEYLRVYLDAERRIIKGIKSNGTQYFGCDIETNGSITEVLDNPEFIRVYTDGSNHILWALTKTGDVVYGVGVPSQIIEIIENTIKPFRELFYTVDNPEFSEVKLDALDKILEGYKKSGNKFFNTPVENDAAEVSATSNLEYMSVLTDAKGIIVNSIDNYLENIRYGGINLTEIKRDLDAQVLEVHIGEDNAEIYTIENNDSTISLEIDDDWNVFEVKDSTCPYELSENEEGEVFIEETIKEI